MSDTIPRVPPQRPVPPRPDRAASVPVELVDDECVVVWRDTQWWCARLDVEHLAICGFDVATLETNRADAALAARGAIRAASG